MANMNINNMLEKMTGKDKDYRYMATSDLLNELNKERFKADPDLEVKLSNIVLQQLEDASGDVSGLAVKCLAPLVKKVSEERILDMTNKLCDKLLKGKDQHRDIASIANEDNSFRSYYNISCSTHSSFSCPPINKGHN